MRYAENTSVPIAQSKTEIEKSYKSGKMPKMLPMLEYVPEEEKK